MAADARVLCVDDEPRVLDGLENNLGLHYEVRTALGGEEGLRAILSDEPYALVISDMRMPGMDGATFLSRVRENAPETMRILLTGYSDIEYAIKAVNEGAVFRFLKKPCGHETLLAAVDSAIASHRLAIATNEKVRLQEEIEQQNARLLETNKQLEKRTAEILRFYHDLSHEIKTPVTAAFMWMSMLHEGVMGRLAEDQLEAVKHAMESCDDLTRHFEDLVECTRLESGKTRVRKSEQSLTRIIRRSVVIVTPAAESKTIELVEECADDLPLVFVDAGRIVQVISDLLDNAIKFTENGGRVSLVAHRSPSQANWIQIEVSDTGIGIPEGELGNIFERLYQVGDKGDAVLGGGLGLGLSIAKEIVRLHDGTIDVRSEVGRGTTFTVGLPLSS